MFRQFLIFGEFQQGTQKMAAILDDDTGPQQRGNTLLL